jgi:hypothetical protein
MPKDQISASISQGSIGKSSEGWTVNVSRPGTATINVSAKVDGESKTMGSKEFRVKTIPTPIAKIGGKSSGALRKNELMALSGIRAELENFDFDVNVVVDSYVFGFTQPNGLLKEERVNSNRFTNEVKASFNAVKPNSNVFFDNIKVKMPDGRTVTLPPVVFKVL